jgi:RNA polymerase sigma factor (sigma-70 family)
MTTFEEWYELLRPLLLYIGEQRFGIEHDEAEAIAHEAFLGLLTPEKDVENAQAYVVAAMFNGCRSYWRRQQRFVDAEPWLQTTIETDEVTRIRVLELLRPLPQREREAVWLRWAAGCTVQEVATHLRMSAGGAQKLLRRARTALMAVEAPAAADDEETERRRVGRSVPPKDTYARRRIIRGHVCPLRGAALPRTHPRLTLLSADRRAPRQVHGQLPRAHGLLQASRGAA